MYGFLYLYFQMKDEDLTPTPEGPLQPPSPFLIVANKLLGGPVILNVGGKRHEVRWNTLDKFPTSRLGRLRHCVTHRGSDNCQSFNFSPNQLVNLSPYYYLSTP